MRRLPPAQTSCTLAAACCLVLQAVLIPVACAQGDAWTWAVKDHNIGVPDVPVYINGVLAGSGDLLTVGHRVVGVASWPEVMALYASGYLRLAPPTAPPTSFGTSGILGPAYWEADTYQHHPTLSEMRLQGDVHAGRELTATLIGTAGKFEVGYVLTLLEPTGHQARCRVATHARCVTGLSLDAGKMGGHEGFKLAQLSSMYIDGTFHDSDALHCVDVSGHEQRDLSTATGGGLLFPDPQRLFEPWLEMAHNGRSSWQGATPSIGIAVLSSTMLPQCTAQGFLAATTNPNDDNVGAWINWDQAPLQWGVGDVVEFEHELIARSAPMQSFSHEFPAALRMVGVPFQQSPAAGIWAAATPEIVRWDPAAETYATLPPSEPPAVGEGYWWLSRTVFELAGWGAPIPTAFSAAVPDGWSIISVPYDAEMALSPILNAPTLQPIAWTDHGSGYELVADLQNGLNQVHRTLQPWWGYWVLSDGPGVIEWDPTDLAETAVKDPLEEVIGSVDREEGGWQIQLCAEAGGRIDAINFLGVAGASAAERLCIPNPPVGVNGVDLYFPSDDGPMAFDIRRLPCVDTRWEFVVACAPGSTVRISFPDLSGLPADRVAALRDLATGAAVALRTARSYEYTADGPRRFALDITRRGAGSALITGVSALQLGQSAAITCVLAEDAQMRLEVRSIAGVPIRRLDCGSRAAGVNTLTWDLCGSSGTRVPSGVYLCTITACAPNGSRASTVKSITIRR